jgi:signal peptidase I
VSDASEPVVDLGRGKRWVLRIAAAVALVAAVIAIALIFFVGLARVGGDDMLPTLGDGAGVVVKRGGTPARGDLILFDDNGATRLRRVIGMPGETLEFEGMIPIVNGERASYADVAEIDVYGRRMKVVRETVAGVSHHVIDDPNRRLTSVPRADTGTGYYVMADFREYGNDSRVYGIVQPAAIRGIYWFAWSRGDRPSGAP